MDWSHIYEFDLANILAMCILEWYIIGNSVYFFLLNSLELIAEYAHIFFAWPKWRDCGGFKNNKDDEKLKSHRIILNFLFFFIIKCDSK